MSNYLTVQHVLYLFSYVRLSSSSSPRPSTTSFMAIQMRSLFTELWPM